MSIEEIKSIEFAPEKLEKVLNEKGFTQAKLNEISGFVHFNTVNKIIKKSRQATATELLRMSKVLDVPAETFVK
jgi:plasmid maintenance system antidote protein VapI